MGTCRHVKKINDVNIPKKPVCEDCLKRGDKWTELRLCMTCGYVGCCDTSKNMHARMHFEETGHPIVRSLHKKDTWMWCYPDQMFVTRE
jgi:uncharacterized UBP type Zn finger protein